MFITSTQIGTCNFLGALTRKVAGEMNDDLTKRYIEAGVF